MAFALTIPGRGRVPLQLSTWGLFLKWVTDPSSQVGRFGSFGGAWGPDLLQASLFGINDFFFLFVSSHGFPSVCLSEKFPFL